MADRLEREFTRILRESARGTFREVRSGYPVVEVNHCHGPGRGHPCVGGGAAAAAHLPEAPDRYFQRDAKTHMVPISSVETIRARPEGIANAEPHMRRAYEGAGGRRGPVTLTPKPGGGYTVLDGNSTVAIARKHGWKKIPAHILTTPGELAAFHQAEAEKKAAKAAKKAAAA